MKDQMKNQRKSRTGSATLSFFSLVAVSLGMFFSHPALFSMAEAGKSPQVLQTSQGDFSVSLTDDKKKLEVLHVRPKGILPPYLRMRILSDKEPPLEMRLQTMRRNDAPLKYSAQFDKNLNSFAGVEFEFSYDEKTWKKLGQTLSGFFK